VNILVNAQYVVKHYLYLFRPLDLFVLLLALMAVLLSFRLWGQTGKALRVQVYQEGQLYQEVDLSVRKIIDVKGPLGMTRVEIQQGQVRIMADPSPRQYCVKEGWLHKVGQVAICLPNHTSIVIVGQNQQLGYDSLSY
jgi:hypothetical protein